MSKIYLPEGQVYDTIMVQNINRVCVRENEMSANSRYIYVCVLLYVCSLFYCPISGKRVGADELSKHEKGEQDL